MARVLIVLGCTFVFTLLGLFIGYLTLRASTPETATHAHEQTLLFCYGAAPIMGGVIGFVLSVVTLRLFDPKK